ncbi:MAG: hypothetical protein JWN13_1338 [Betaproteobacteria bacterium]|jgi:hypothetical protein|nr:hypothetical protein [Betaproteobacteria bacterium]
MSTTRRSKAAILSIALAFASVAINAPAAEGLNEHSSAPATQATPLDMHDFLPVHLSAESSYAFYDGTESASSASAGAPRALIVGATNARERE